MKNELVSDYKMLKQLFFIMIILNLSIMFADCVTFMQYTGCAQPILATEVDNVVTGQCFNIFGSSSTSIMYNGPYVSNPSYFQYSRYSQLGCVGTPYPSVYSLFDSCSSVYTSRAYYFKFILPTTLAPRTPAPRTPVPSIWTLAPPTQTLSPYAQSCTDSYMCQQCCSNSEVCIQFQCTCGSYCSATFPPSTPVPTQSPQSDSGSGSSATFPLPTPSTQSGSGSGSSNNYDFSPQSSTLSTGAIIGIVIGIIVFIPLCMLFRSFISVQEKKDLECLNRCA